MINLAKFQKVSEDGKTATLQHEDGHEMKVLLKALSPVQREQMKRLKMAKGGKVKNYDDGGGVSSDSAASDSDNASQAQPATNITINAAPANSSAAAPTSTPVAATGPAAGSAPPQAPAGTTSSLVDPALTQTPPINQPNIAPAQNVNAPNSNPLPALNQLNQSAQDEAKIQAAKAKALQPAYDAQALAQAKLLQNIQDSHDRIIKATDTYANYINQNPIDAQRFAKNMTGGQKTASAIGLFLGGFSAPLGGHNYALDEINNAISRDIDAQKTNATNQHNVWSSYNDLFHDDQLATQLSQVTLNNIMSKHIDAVANQLGTATAAMQAKRYGAEAALKNNEIIKKAYFGLGLKGMGVSPQISPQSTQPSESVPIPDQANIQSTVSTRNIPEGAPRNPPPSDSNDNSNNGTTGIASFFPSFTNTNSGANAAAARAAGNNSESNSGNNGKNENYQVPAEESELVPNADQMITDLERRASGGDPTAAAELNQVKEEKGQLTKFERNIPKMREAYNNMVNERGGILGRLRRSVGLQDLGGDLGAAVGAGVGASGGPAGAIVGGSEGSGAGRGLGRIIGGATSREVDRAYDKDEAALMKVIAAGVSGTNLGSGDINHLVSAERPEVGDSPKNIQKGWDDLINGIRGQLSKDALIRNHMIKTKKLPDAA